MNETQIWLASRRFLWLGYLLLWPPMLVVATRKSHQPDILGWWSQRMFGIVVAAGLVIVVATLVVILTRADSQGHTWLDRFVTRVRTRSLLSIFLLLGPSVGWLSLVAYMGVIDVPLSAPLVICLLDLGALVATAAAAFVFIGRPSREQRLLAIKCLLAGFSFVLAIGAVEATAWMLGLSAYRTWELNPKNLDVKFKTDDFDVSVKTNKQGLREQVEVPSEKRGSRRVVVVGDSMTFGWGVEASEAYPRVLESLLRERLDAGPIEVVNMGRPGSSPNNYLKYVQHYAAELQPDLIVIGLLIGNDCPVTAPAHLRDERELAAELSSYIEQARVNHTERWLFRSFLFHTTYAQLLPSLRTRGARAYEGRRGPIFGEPNPLDRRTIQDELVKGKDREEAARRLHVLQETGWVDKGLRWEVNPWLIRAVALHPAGAADSLATREETFDTMRLEWRLCEGLLDEMRDASRSAGAKFAVLAIPNAHLVSQRWVDFLNARGCVTNEQMTRSKVVNDWLESYCERAAVVRIDPLEQFRAVEDPAELYLRTDDHMTAAGHRLLAEAASEGLVSLLEGPARED